MSANFKTVLVLGATSGLGEAFTRRLHAQGKKVIATGRRIERLQALKAQLPGLETFQFDVTDFTNLETNIKSIITAFPTLDTVCVFSGKLELLSFKDPTSSTNESIISEINLNITAPALLARYFIPHLLSLAPRPTTFMLLSSGMAYIPFKYFPVYTLSKAAMHNFAIQLRSDTADSNLSIIELCPPYVDTDLDKHVRSKIDGHGPPPMPLEKYMDVTMESLAKTENGKPLREVAVGFAEIGAGAWRAAFGPLYEKFGIQA